MRYSSFTYKLGCLVLLLYIARQSTSTQPRPYKHLDRSDMRTLDSFQTFMRIPHFFFFPTGVGGAASFISPAWSAA